MRIILDTTSVPYPDELVYSLLARYYAKSGYMAYRYAAEDIFSNPTVRPDIELVNAYTSDALSQLTRAMPMETIIEKHTMFPYYGRFLPKERRQSAFRAMVNLEGNYSNLLVFSKRKSSGNRYLRYCPLCAADDRKHYGETYWHRLHQMQGVNICPLHGCYLIDSDIVISGKASPMLVSAEESITNDNVTICKNDVELRLARYIAAVFQADIDMESDVLAGDFLHSRMGGTVYRSIRGQQRNIALLNVDFQAFYKDLPENWLSELWALQKVLTNNKVNLYEICMFAMFLGVPAPELSNMRLPEKTQEQLFDEQIYMLHAQGLKYPAIAEKLGASINIVKSIGEGRYGTYHKEPKKPNKSGAKPKDWKQIDIDLLPEVKKAIGQLQGDGVTRPKKVTIAAIEKIIGLKPKQIDNLPQCKAEIQRHYLSQKEYWAIESVWAAKVIIREGQPFNWNHFKKLTNMRKRDLISCLPYIRDYADNEMYEKIMSIAIQ